MTLSLQVAGQVPPRHPGGAPGAADLGEPAGAVVHRQRRPEEAAPPGVRAAPVPAREQLEPALGAAVGGRPARREHPGAAHQEVVAPDRAEVAGEAVDGLAGHVHLSAAVRTPGRRFLLPKKKYYKHDVFNFLCLSFF